MPRRRIAVKRIQRFAILIDTIGPKVFPYQRPRLFTLSRKPGQMDTVGLGDGYCLEIIHRDPAPLLKRIVDGTRQIGISFN